MREVYILIKDSVIAESVILEKDVDYDFLLKALVEVIKIENDIRISHNKTSSNIMESKHGKYYYPMFKNANLKTTKELIRYGDGHTSYRIERI